MMEFNADSFDPLALEVLGRHFGLDSLDLATMDIMAAAHPLVSLQDRVTAITGASKGIGRRVAELFAIHGADLIIHGRNEQDLESLAEVVQKLGSRVEIVTGNLGEEETATKLMDIVKLKYNNKLDILVNNAGAPSDKLYEKYSPKQWGEILGGIKTNLGGPMLMTAAVYKNIQAAGRSGRIISMGSVSGQEGVEGQAIYAASKAGILGATKVWAAELLKTGGTANVIAFGPVETAIWDRSRIVGRKLVERAGGDPTLDPLQPLGNRMLAKRFVTPEEAARSVLYLASDMGSQTTRQVLVVDGGVTTLSLS